MANSALPDINWTAVYKSLQMTAAYEQADKSFPNWQDPNLWVIPAVAGVTFDKVIAAMRESGIKVCASSDENPFPDLKVEIVHNDRDPANGSYQIGFCRSIEPDRENRDLSADVLESQKHKGITRLEQVLLSHGYFLTTGKHLNVKCITLCPASRYSDGSVPTVEFNPGSGYAIFGLCSPGHHYDPLRSRTAFFPPPAR
ncbi:MAG: hypothetical protein ABSA74_02345 [Candidatus Staskawiczbacteria bacterium]|jgi:hypothetical protein